MAEQQTVTVKSRYIGTHDTEANWTARGDTAIPKCGEIIIYDIDANHTYERIKVGDGVTSVKNLPFASVSEVEMARIIASLQQDIDANRIHVSSTQPTYACTWFKVKSITQ
jgi:hypothetical protein